MRTRTSAALCLTGAWSVHGFGGIANRHYSVGTSRSPLSCPTTFLAHNHERSSKHGFIMTPSQRQRTGRSMLMLVEPSGKDALTALTDSENAISSTIRKTPSGIRKLAGMAVIPLSAALGYVLTPSGKIAAGAVGAGLTGIIGTVTKSRLDVYAEESILPALANALLPHTENQFASTAEIKSEIEDIAQGYSVDSEDFAAICSTLYLRYLLAMCQNPLVKTSDITEIQNLKTALDLSNIDVGEAHAAAAAELYRTKTLFTPEEELEDPAHPDRRCIDKLLFLSERVIRTQEDTPEAFSFEMSRVVKGLHVPSNHEAMERVYDVAEPFYKRALASTRSKLDSGAVNQDMLARARNSLGIDEYHTKELHLAAYNEEIRNLLGKSTQDPEDQSSQQVEEETDDADVEFQLGAKARLDTLRDLLDISPEDADYELSVEVTPLFQKTVITLIDAALENPSEANSEEIWEKIQYRQSQLLLSEKTAQPLLKSILVQRLGTPLESAMNFARVENEKNTHKELLQALGVQQSLQKLLGNYLNMDDFYDPESTGSAIGFLSPGDRKKLYTMFVSRTILKGATEDVNVQKEQQEQLQSIQTLLGVTDYDVQDTSRIVCGPLIEKQLKGCAFEVTGEEEEATEELLSNLKQGLDDFCERYRIPSDLLKDYAKNIYKDSVRVAILKFPSGIPSADMAKRLESLRDLFQLTIEDIHPIHNQAFGPAYKKSVLESMGSTGIIRKEYRSALTTLQERLALSSDDADKLFNDAISEKLKPMIQLLSNELERTQLTQQQLSQKRGKDMGEDVFKSGGPKAGTALGIDAQGNILSEMINLVDFYKENDIGKVQTGTETKNNTEVPVYEQTFPVTGLSLSALDPEMAVALFRQFIVGGFTAQQQNLPDANRYEEETSTFGSILGLKPEQQEEVSSTIGDMIYENYLRNSMQTKDTLDQQDMMFLAQIQSKLNLSDEKAGEMMMQAQKKVMFDNAQALFESFTDPGQQDTLPARIAAYREKSNAMGLDLLTDIELPRDRVENMFSIEVISGINSGKITPENADELSEMQSSYGFSSEEAEAVLRRVVDNQCRTALEKMDKFLLRGKNDICVPELKKYLSFVEFTDGEFADNEAMRSIVGEDVKNKIMNVYDASIGSDLEDEEGGEEKMEEQRLLLSTALGLE